MPAARSRLAAIAMLSLRPDPPAGRIPRLRRWPPAPRRGERGRCAFQHRFSRSPDLWGLWTVPRTAAARRCARRFVAGIRDILRGAGDDRRGLVLLSPGARRRAPRLGTGCRSALACAGGSSPGTYADTAHPAVFVAGSRRGPGVVRRRECVVVGRDRGPAPLPAAAGRAAGADSPVARRVATHPSRSAPLSASPSCSTSPRRSRRSATTRSTTCWAP
jgi:hypothetical protein